MSLISDRRDERLAFLIGPTAVGKTSIGIELARLINAEILSVDARQIYKQLQLGTAKPTSDECSKVPHHLINLFDPSERVSAVQFEAVFADTVTQLYQRGKGALCVGGSGLYVDACLGRIDPMPPSDPTIRARHRRLQALEGNEALHRRLARIDPVTAERLSPADYQRVSRALEIFELTGSPISAQQSKQGPMDLGVGPPMILLHRDREALYRRIEQRAREMLDEGLINEVAALLENGVAPDSPAFESIGYSEFAKVVSGELALEEATASFIQRTRRYAKRQITWFRNRYTGTCELSISDEDRPADIAEKAAALIQATPGWQSGV
jgi:tRNA dimethylallyltransferase